MCWPARTEKHTVRTFLVLLLGVFENDLFGYHRNWLGQRYKWTDFSKMGLFGVNALGIRQLTSVCILSLSRFFPIPLHSELQGTKVHWHLACLPRYMHAIYSES